MPIIVIPFCFIFPLCIFPRFHSFYPFVSSLGFTPSMSAAYHRHFALALLFESWSFLGHDPTSFPSPSPSPSPSAPASSSSQLLKPGGSLDSLRVRRANETKNLFIAFDKKKDGTIDKTEQQRLVSLIRRAGGTFPFPLIFFFFFFFFWQKQYLLLKDY